MWLWLRRLPPVHVPRVLALVKHVALQVWCACALWGCRCGCHAFARMIASSHTHSAHRFATRFDTRPPLTLPWLLTVDFVAAEAEAVAQRAPPLPGRLVVVQRGHADVILHT